MSQPQPKIPATSSSQAELIRKEVNRLHDQGSGDWQSLSSQVLSNYKPICMNTLQIAMAMIPGLMPKRRGEERGTELYVEAGRGAGKSTGISTQMRRVAQEMPRSNNIIIGSTYQQILIRTLPATIAGLEMQGWFQNLHFFVGRRPPQSWKWPLPYQPPSRWEKAIYFYTGAVYNLISQDVAGDGRGLNVDSAIADEAALLNKAKLDGDTRPTVRGSKLSQFRDHPLFLSELYCSTTPLTAEGKWFVDAEETAIQQQDVVKFLKATCQVNRHNLPADYLEKALRGTLKWIYEAEYLNIRPNFVKDGFYTLLNEEQHCYSHFNYSFYDAPGKQPDCRGDSDLVAGLPLILGVDWGAAINCLTVNQHLRPQNEYRTINGLHVLGDNKQIQDDLFRDFHNYYRYHDTKVVYLHYDATGNLRTGNTRATRAQQARKILTGLGWEVHLMTNYATNPQHELKYLLWQHMLKEETPRLPRYRMNRSNCRNVFVSMRNAKVKQGGNGEIKKDKRSESSKVIPRQEATDLSDANDQPIWNLFRHLLNDLGTGLPGARVGSH